MECPVCSIDLLMAERRGVEIDYCPQCRGVWLDRGELDKIIECSQQEYRPPAGSSRPDEPLRAEQSGDERREHSGDRRPRDHRDGHDEAYDRKGSSQKKSKGSFLADIFEGFGG